MFERVNAKAGTSATLHALRHTAAYRMAEDPSLPLTDVQFVLGHAQLTTTQLYLTPRKEVVIRRLLAHHAAQTRQAAARIAPPPAADYRPESLDVLFGTGAPMTITSLARAGFCAPAAGLEPQLTRSMAAQQRFPARAVPGIWPGTERSRTEVARLLSRPPFTLENAGSELHHKHGIVMVLDWLEDQSGQTWQERWLASGIEQAGCAWRPVIKQWLHERGLKAAWRMPVVGRALTTVISADLLRPSVDWLAAGASRQGVLVRSMSRSRDPHGFERLRELGASVEDVRSGAVSAALCRSALILAAKGGMLTGITVGDVLELFEAQATVLKRMTAGTEVFYRLLHQLGALGEDAPQNLREVRNRGQRTP